MVLQIKNHDIASADCILPIIPRCCGPPFCDLELPKFQKWRKKHVIA